MRHLAYPMPPPYCALKIARCLIPLPPFGLHANQSYTHNEEILMLTLFRPRTALLALLLTSMTVLAAACSPATPEPAVETPEMSGMDMDMPAAPSAPAGLAYAEGEETRFMHT